MSKQGNHRVVTLHQLMVKCLIFTSPHTMKWHDLLKVCFEPWLGWVPYVMFSFSCMQPHLHVDSAASLWSLNEWSVASYISKWFFTSPVMVGCRIRVLCHDLVEFLMMCLVTVGQTLFTYWFTNFDLIESDLLLTSLLGLRSAPLHLHSESFTTTQPLEVISAGWRFCTISRKSRHLAERNQLTHHPVF